MPGRDEILTDLTASGRFELTVAPSDGGDIRVFRRGPGSLRDVLLASRDFADRPFLAYEDELLSYREHFARVASVAGLLSRRGIGKGDRVALAMRNYPEWVVAFWAAQAIGAIAVALNGWWTTAELEHALADSEPSALFVDDERFERVRPLLAARKDMLTVVARMDSVPDGHMRFADAIGDGVNSLPDVAIGRDDPATILYTSGTTGKPKGAVLTHGNHVSDLMTSALMGAADRRLKGLSRDNAPSASVGLQTFPFFHIGGVGALYNTMAAGSELVLMYKWDAVEAVRLIEHHKVTSIAGVPIVMRRLLEAAADLGTTLDSVAAAGCGGAPVPPDLIERIDRQLGSRAAPGTGYGMTETTGGIAGIGGDDYVAHPTSIGRPYPTTDLRVAGLSGEQMPPGEIGELWIRGPNVIPGYWNNPAATAEAFERGWFKSGDLGYVDARGLHFIVDRKKDVIIRGGENIYCAEVEAALLAHPDVKDAAVVGLPHEAYGEEVAAVVQIGEEVVSSELEGALPAFLARSLAAFKVPSVLRFTHAELPRGATGKLVKRDIRAAFFGTAAAPPRS